MAGACRQILERGVDAYHQINAQHQKKIDSLNQRFSFLVTAIALSCALLVIGALGVAGTIPMGITAGALLLSAGILGLFVFPVWTSINRVQMLRYHQSVQTGEAFVNGIVDWFKKT